MSLQRQTKIHLASLGASVLLATIAPHAIADDDDVLNILGSANVTYDSNLFRRPDSADPQSDVISTGSVGLRIDKPYAQQRFQAEVIETAIRYDKFSYLNFNALNYKAAWLWHLTPRISGVLSADRSKSLVAFADTLSTTKNVRITENRIFSADAMISGAWHGIVGLAQNQQKSEQPSEADPDFRSVSGEAGIRYLTPNGSSVALVQRHTKGEYLNSVFVSSANFAGSDDYRQEETELQATWAINARSSATGRIAWLDRRNQNFTQGDFSGFAGRIGYKWTPTGKVTVDVGAQRELSSWQELGATYRVENILSVSPTWQITNKIALRARIAHSQAYYRGGNASLSDKADIGQVGVDWIPLRFLTVGASLQREERTSSVDSLTYDDTLVSLAGSIKF